MSGASIRSVAGVLVLGGGVLLSMASADPEGGERTDGECPAGETCSPDTPNGLYFSGARLGDEVLVPEGAPLRTAVGGRQTIHVYRDEDASQDFVGFTALSSGPAFSIGASSGNTVGIDGETTGDAYLRLVDPQNDELYDRISLGVAEVDSVALIPSRLALVGDKELYEAAKPAVVYHAEYGLHAFALGLFDAAGVRLADESLSFTLPPALERNTSAWDMVVPAAADNRLAKGEHVVGFMLGSGDTGSETITVVDSVDALIWVPGSTAGEETQPAGGVLVDKTQSFCFRAENGGRPVVGAPWSYSATSGLEVTPTSSNCVSVKGLAVGVQTLTVIADEIAEPFDVPVSAAAASAAPSKAAVVKKPAAAARAAAWRGLGAGDRARTARALPITAE